MTLFDSFFDGKATTRRSVRQEVCLACTCAALVFYGVALALPVATATRFGLSQAGYLLTGAVTLWDDGYQPMAVLIAAVGLGAPVALGAIVLWTHALLRKGHSLHRLRPLLKLTTWVEAWALPDVQLLGVIVALTKLSSLVETRIGPGFWCYALAAAFTWLAWHFHAPSDWAVDAKRDHSRESLS